MKAAAPAQLRAAALSIRQQIADAHEALHRRHAREVTAAQTRLAPLRAALVQTAARLEALEREARPTLVDLDEVDWGQTRLESGLEPLYELQHRRAALVELLETKRIDDLIKRIDGLTFDALLQHGESWLLKEGWAVLGQPWIVRRQYQELLVHIGELLHSITGRHATSVAPTYIAEPEPAPRVAKGIDFDPREL